MERPHPKEILEDFARYPFFSGFGEDLLLQICTMASRARFPVGHVLLKEGQSNEQLIFLNKGSVQVVIEGEVVSTLTKSGEVLGEMSVISRQPVSATLIAISDIECYFVNTEDFQHVHPKDKVHFQYLIYKVYASILANRLRATNAKARQHEVANRDLILTQAEIQEINANLEYLVQQRTSQLESQNAALTAGFKMLTDQAETRKVTRGRIEALQQLSLPELRRTLKESLQLLDKSSPTVGMLERLQSELDAIDRQLTSVVEMQSTSRGLEERRVLFLETEKKQQLVARMSLGGTGVNLDIAGTTEAAQDLIGQNIYDLVFSDMSFSSSLESFHQKRPEIPIVVMASQSLRSDLLHLQNLDFIRHLVSRDVNDRSLTSKIMVTTINKILTRDYFGLEKYLAWGVDVSEIKLTKSNERSAAIEKMKEAFQKLGVRTSFLDRLGLVAEELLMNAIYDAPHDEKGEPIFNHLPRTESVQLKAHQAARFRYACDGNLLAVSVLDPFGALKKKTIFDYLQSCYDGLEVSSKTKKGGAGRGLHQIVENSDLSIFNVQPLKATEAICLFHLETQVVVGERQPSLQFFEVS